MATTRGHRVRLGKRAAWNLPHADETGSRGMVLCRGTLAFRHRDAAEVAA